MPTFREVNTGQHVNVNESDAAWFRSQARWQSVDGEKPETEGVAGTVAEKKAAGSSTEKADEVKHADRNIDGTHDVTPADEQPELPDRPADDADRDEWVAYALAHGKTEQEIGRKQVSTIRGWFDND